ncbi:hypothetical protein Tco_1250710, partial [Tanacetum coccineum]
NNKQQGLKLDDRGFQIEEDSDELEYPQELFSTVDLLFLQYLVSSISIGSSICFEGFLSSMLLLVVIIVMVVFVVVIWVVIFVNVIVGVIVVVFGIVVVGGGVSSIFKLSFVIVDSFSCYWSSACPGVLMLTSFWEAFYQQNMIRTLRGYGMIHEDGDNDAIGGNDDERAINNAVKEEDEEQICFLGGNNSSGTKKYRGSNSSDGGNIRDRVKIAGGVIDYFPGKTLKELLPDEAGK